MRGEPCARIMECCPRGYRQLLEPLCCGEEINYSHVETKIAFLREIMLNTWVVLNIDVLY